MSKVSVAVVGAGYWGPNLIRNFATLPGCSLVTVCDLDRDRLARVRTQYPAVRTTTSLDALLADRAIDAVAIATPAATHRTIAVACLRAGKHVYVEKPLAATVADAEAISRAAEDAARVLMVGHLFLYDPTVVRLIELVLGGDIGTVRYIHGIRTSMGGTARLDTNIIWDALIHDAYILPAVFARPPQRVIAVGQGYLDPHLEDVAFASFDFGNGALAHVYVSWYALEKARRLTVIGSDAILAHDDLGEHRLTLFARRYEQSAAVDPQGRTRWCWRDDGGQPIAVPDAEPLREECAHFLSCVAGRCQPRTDGPAGVQAVRITAAVQRSLDAGNVWVDVS